ncbi:MAG: AAA family ATPase [Blastocatellales bacterium]
MRKYLKESLHWFHLTFFKPETLEAESERFDFDESGTILLKVYPVTAVIFFALLVIVGGGAASFGYPFKWGGALSRLFLGLVGGLFFGFGLGLQGGLLLGPVFALGWGVHFGFGMDFGQSSGLGIGLGAGLLVGLYWGLSAGVGGDGERQGPVSGLILGLVFGFVAGLVTSQTGGFEKGVTKAVSVWTGYLITFLSLYFRPFYVFPHLFQYWRAERSSDPLKLFHNSPVHWDEVIAVPLPYLTTWLVRLTNYDRKRGLDEILFVTTKRPYQRRAAQKALLTVAIQDLQRINTLEKMAHAAESLKFLPSRSKFLPAGLNRTQHHINAISNLAQDYLTRLTPVGQMKVLEDLRSEVATFCNAMALISQPVGAAFQLVASRWLEIVRQTEEECRRQMAFEPIPNPFVAGNPLQQRDQDLFKGRKDIIIAIEENIINPGQRPSLLLYGRRRIGKTSTLLNLPRLLSSQFTPVFIDCQNAKWRDGDAAFCYHLAASVYGELFQRNLHDGLGKPDLEQFEKYAFTRLDEFLDQIEALLRRINKQILLTFDEYERLEEGIAAQKITREVFNQLRNIVQHRERIVVLFSGSHRFEELRVVNWSDYLINVKTLELSFLAPEDARELLTEPVPALHYEPGLVEAIIALTHCQPYLLQAVASDLVNYLNAQKRQTATMADLDVAVAKVLVTADAYFHNNWEECAETEREVLRALARGEADRVAAPQYQAAVQSLSRKEIVEIRDDRYLFTVELFRLWVEKNHLPKQEGLS